MNRDSSPLRYLPYQARDVAAGPLALFVAITIGLTLALWRFFADSPAISDNPALFLTSTLAVVQTIAILFATGGVAGVDIQRGFYRAWFSKPITPWLFYLQRWLLGGIAVLLIPVMLGSGLSLLYGNGTGITWALIGSLALAYLLVGGLVLLCSNFMERDWLAVFLITFLQAQLHRMLGLFEQLGQEISPLLVWTDRLLPPFHLVVPSAGLPSGSELLHVLGYGGGVLAVALLLFRHRPLGSGGRA